MDKIYKFDEFVLILESREKIIEKKLFDDLKKIMLEDLFKRWTSCPNFGGLYTKPGGWGLRPGLQEIFYIWSGKEKKVDEVFYDGHGGFFVERYPDIRITKEQKDLYSGMFTYTIFDSIKQDVMDDCGAPIFNPFTNNIEDLPIIKELKKVGMEIISNDLEKSKGILVLKFKDSDYYDFIIIKPSGEINYKTLIRGSIDTPYDWKELIKPINNLEDLIRKIIYVYIKYYLEGIIFNVFGLKELPERLISALKSKENINNPIYKEEYDKIVQRYPKMALYLPEPPGSKNKGLVKGVRLLDRSRLLD